MALQMQQALVRPSCRPLSAPAPSFHGPQTLRHTGLLALPSRRRAGHCTRVQAFGNTAAWAATSDTAWMSSVASALGFAIGAFFIARELTLEQSRMDTDNDVECSTCGGTGYVECMCTRWSDGDAGCPTCRGTLKMTCNGCGGTGTGVPLPAKVMAQRSGPYINLK